MAKKKNPEVRQFNKVESVEEYLARGGAINRLEEKVREPQVDVIRKTVTGGPATFLSLEDADLFYGEARKGIKPKKAKPSLKIDLEALPLALRAKFIAKLKEDVDGYEEELEEIGEDEPADTED
jgi:hypothetical protein